MDDIPHPFLLEELVRHVVSHPECALVYSDAETFSDDGRFHRLYFSQPSITGPLFDRMIRYLTHNFDSVGYRALIAKWALDRAGLLENNPFDELAEDTLWTGKIAREGELHRLRYPLYRKRYHDGNTHLKWFRKTEQELTAAIRFHCEKMVNVFLAGIDDPEQKRKLREAGEMRLDCFMVKIHGALCRNNH